LNPIGNMAHNDEAGPAKQPTEQLQVEPQQFLNYIASQDSGSQARQPLRITEGAPGSDTTETGNTETTNTEGGNQTTDGGNQNTDGASQGSSRSKKQQKPRPPNKLRIGSLDVHSVHPSTFDIESPWNVSACYGNDVACILRETVNINQTNIREEGGGALENLLLEKIHGRF